MAEDVLPFQGDTAGVSPVHATAHPAPGNVKARPHVPVHHLSPDGEGKNDDNKEHPHDFCSHRGHLEPDAVWLAAAVFMG